MPQVEYPDGTIVDFPEGTPDITMQAVSTRFYDPKLNEFNYNPQPFEHGMFVNPLQGIPEAFAKGVYEAPGQLAAIFDQFSPWAGLVQYITGKPLQQSVDELTQNNQLPYNPDDYGATALAQSVARLSGNMVGDPLNALPIGKISLDGVKAYANSIESVPRMFNQAGSISKPITTMGEDIRISRAKNAGFDLNNVFHTGSNQQLTYFDDTKLGAITGDTSAGKYMSQVGHYGTSDINVAKKYAKNAVEKRGGIESITDFVVTKDGQGVIDMSKHDLNPAELAGFLLDQKDAGARSFIIKNIRDTIDGTPTDIVVVMDKTAARSPKAKFIDFSSDSFTAALAGVGLGVPLALSTNQENDSGI